MFKMNVAEEATKLAGNTVQNKVTETGEGMKQMGDQVTKTGQKAYDDVCKTAKDTGENMTKGASQITSWGKSFGQNEEKKEGST